MMRKINDYKELSPIIIKYYKKGVITNNFMTPQGYKSEIALGNLYVDEQSEYLCIYVKRIGYYILYFYAANENVILPRLSEKVLCEASGEVEKILTNSGFSHYLARVRLQKQISDADYTKLSDGVEMAKIDDAKSIHGCFETYFDKFTSWIPSVHELSVDCENKAVYTVKMGNDIVAALRTSPIGKNTMIKQLCVADKYKRQGLARLMLIKYFKDNPGKKCTVWTGKNNSAALGLYKSLGFIEDGATSNVYMKG